MIKVGDIININGNDEIIKEINKYMIVLKNGLCYTHEEVYVQLYEQQKKRADELEKRWSELVNIQKKKYEYYKVKADDESFGPIEQSKWEDAKHEGMMLLKVMTDLQENDE